MKKIFLLLIAMTILSCKQKNTTGTKIQVTKIDSDVVRALSRGLPDDTLSNPPGLLAYPIQTLAKEWGDSVKITILYQVSSMAKTNVRLMVIDTDSMAYYRRTDDYYRGLFTDGYLEKRWNLGTVEVNPSNLYGMVTYTRSSKLSKTFWLKVNYYDTCQSNHWWFSSVVKITRPPISKVDHLNQMTQHDMPGWLLLDWFRQILKRPPLSPEKD